MPCSAVDFAADVWTETSGTNIVCSERPAEIGQPYLYWACEMLNGRSLRLKIGTLPREHSPANPQTWVSD